ncbi:MAG: septum formation initiator family protein, partial [Nitrospinota bacterium]
MAERRKERFLLLLTLAFSLFLLGLATFSKGGILDALRLERRIEAIKADLQGIRAENERLCREVRSLKTDLRYIEKIAREDL